MLLQFEYTNHRGDDHTYVIDPLPTRREAALHPRHSPDFEGYWCVSGDVVTRDGDPRPDMGVNRRRTFQLCKMRGIREVERSA